VRHTFLAHSRQWPCIHHEAPSQQRPYRRYDPKSLASASTQERNVNIRHASNENPVIVRAIHSNVATLLLVCSLQRGHLEIAEHNCGQCFSIAPIKCPKDRAPFRDAVYRTGDVMTVSEYFGATGLVAVILWGVLGLLLRET
jgi:hypothetical protein